jgi:valyl-tRNA synthetase
MNLEGQTLPMQGAGADLTYGLPEADALSLPDRWILSRLQNVTSECTRLIEEYQLGEAGRQLYDYLWGDFCDWYIEAAKVRLYDGTVAEAQATRQVAAHVLERSLRLLHPFMPYVTEAIWQNLPGMAGSDGEFPRALMVSRWPQAGEATQAHAGDGAFLDAEADFGRVQDVVRAIRNARSEYDVAPGKRIPAHISAPDAAAMFSTNVALLASLARIDPAASEIAADLPAPDKSVTLAVTGATVYLPLAGLVDFAAERARLGKELAGLEQQVGKIEALLGNEGFTAKAPANVIEREKGRLAELSERRDQLAQRLAEMGE